MDVYRDSKVCSPGELDENRSGIVLVRSAVTFVLVERSPGVLARNAGGGDQDEEDDCCHCQDPIAV